MRSRGLASLQLSTTSFVADDAWAWRASAAWQCADGHCSDDLLYLTRQAGNLSYNSPPHPRYPFGLQTALTRIARSMGGIELASFAFALCNGEGSGSPPSPPKDDGNDEHQQEQQPPRELNRSRVCSQVLLEEETPELLALAHVWVLALPGGVASVASSYQRTRSFVYDPVLDGPVDRNALQGPPMAAHDSARTARVSCGPGAGQFACEHRQPMVAGMPLWRREVEGSWRIIHVESPDGPSSVAFGRTVETQGGRRRAGWILLNRGSSSLASVPAGHKGQEFRTGLPPGLYENQGGAYVAPHDDGDLDAMFSELARDLHLASVTIDELGHARIADVPPHSAIILHTGRAILQVQGVPLGVLFLLLVLFVAVAYVAVVRDFKRMWRHASVEVRTSAAVCEMEHNLPTGDKGPRPEQFGVLMSCLEHVVPSLGIKVVAGGLGNVAQHYIERNPVPGKFVFAMIDGPDYSAFELTTLTIVLKGIAGRVEVLTYQPEDSPMQFVALRHPMFTERTKESIYPDTRRTQVGGPCARLTALLPGRPCRQTVAWTW